ncbi:hypothetical protein MMA25_24035, partial [Salmonella enterica]|nr:hypothetical protein [Salmonella enterica]
PPPPPPPAPAPPPPAFDALARFIDYTPCVEFSSVLYLYNGTGGQYLDVVGRSEERREVKD